MLCPAMFLFGHVFYSDFGAFSAFLASQAFVLDCDDRNTGTWKRRYRDVTMPRGFEGTRILLPGALDVLLTCFRCAVITHPIASHLVPSCPIVSHP